jgi:LmbE family N-acetylglucosaminyl deacetylase
MVLILGLLLLSAPTTAAQTDPANVAAPSKDTIELHQALLDLTNPWTVMCVAAHPDDEDGATLTILRRKYGVHTVSLFSTFGEGGQNAIGPELYEELGAIRAQETVKASEIQGSEPHFLGLKDFGFSKSAEEAFRFWGHDEALRRMVLQIRKLRPDIIITNHNTTSGHGHHQATGRLVLEAFEAAADPKRFPEQLKETNIWQVKRLFVRRPSQTKGDSSDRIVVVDRNEMDPIRGTTYAEQALRALQQHASQGPWPQALPKEGMPPINYALVREASKTTPLSTTAPTLFDRLTLSSALSNKLSLLALNGSSLIKFVDDRQRVFEALIEIYDRFMKAGKIEEDFARASRLNERYKAALILASGIKLSISTPAQSLVPGIGAAFTVTANNDGGNEVLIRSGVIGRKGEWSEEAGRLDFPKRLAPRTEISRQVTVTLPRDAPLSVPRFAHLYDNRWRGEEILAAMSVALRGRRFIVFASTYRDVSPAIEIASASPNPYVFTPANLNVPLVFKIRLRNNLDKPFKGQFGISSPNDHVTEVGAAIELAPKEMREFTIQSNVIPVDTPDERRTPRDDFGPVIVSVHPWEKSETISEREIRVVYSDARIAPNLKVGYVRSFDDSLRNALTALGVQAQELSVDDISKIDVSKFDTIVIDNRGYLAHPKLVELNPRLLDFAKNGGTLIVFYHRTNEWNPDPSKNRPNLAPYPITLGDERVTDENAPVTITEPLHPLLNTPNKIGHDDFKGWIQERGLYYPKSWDAHYQSIFSMSDAGEEPLRGGLLVADYGKGHYIYTSMVWYRQLRAGVPGGYRMFANMISYGKTDAK